MREICKRPAKCQKQKLTLFCNKEDAHTKYRQIQRKFPRLKVIAYEINEIWPIDVALQVGKI